MEFCFWLAAEPVELLLDRRGRGHKLGPYPLPQFKLLLLLNRQNDFEPCFVKVIRDNVLISLSSFFIKTNQLVNSKNILTAFLVQILELSILMITRIQLN